MVILFAGLSAYLIIRPPQEKEGSLSMQNQAWEYIMTTIKQQIDVSGSVQFPHAGYQNATHLGNNRYQATSYAEVITGPDKKELRYFNIIVEHRDNSWATESLKFASE